jgi:GxxExxY protein
MDTNAHTWNANGDGSVAVMEADGSPMYSGENKFTGPAADLSYAVAGFAMEVLNTLGHGYHEKPYERALVVELGLRKIPFQQQATYPLIYKNVVVGEFIPDLIVRGELVVDTKVIEKITNRERGQVLNYLRRTNLRAALILNFKNPKLEWERLVL